MIRNGKILFIALFVFIIAGSIGVARRYYKWSEAQVDALAEAYGLVDESERALEAQGLTCTAIKKDYISMNVLTEALAEVSSVPYDRHTDNCYDHSQALQQKLKASGVLSFIATTDDRDGNGLADHAYVLVAVESVEGELAPTYPYLMRDYIPLRELRDDNLKVICN